VSQFTMKFKILSAIEKSRKVENDLDDRVIGNYVKIEKIVPEI
jgi:hypothetical protein